MYRVSTLFLTPDCYIVLENFIFVSFQLMEEKKIKVNHLYQASYVDFT